MQRLVNLRLIALWALSCCLFLPSCSTTPQLRDVWQELLAGTVDSDLVDARTLQYAGLTETVGLGSVWAREPSGGFTLWQAPRLDELPSSVVQEGKYATVAGQRMVKVAADISIFGRPADHHDISDGRQEALAPLLSLAHTCKLSAVQLRVDRLQVHPYQQWLQRRQGFSLLHAIQSGKDLHYVTAAVVAKGLRATLSLDSGIDASAYVAAANGARLPGFSITALSDTELEVRQDGEFLLAGRFQPISDPTRSANAPASPRLPGPLLVTIPSGYFRILDPSASQSAASPAAMALAKAERLVASVAPGSDGADYIDAAILLCDEARHQAAGMPRHLAEPLQIIANIFKADLLQKTSRSHYCAEVCKETSDRLVAYEKETGTIAGDALLDLGRIEIAAHLQHNATSKARECLHRLSNRLTATHCGEWRRVYLGLLEASCLETEGNPKAALDMLSAAELNSQTLAGSIDDSYIRFAILCGIARLQVELGSDDSASDNLASAEFLMHQVVKDRPYLEPNFYMLNSTRAVIQRHRNDLAGSMGSLKGALSQARQILAVDHPVCLSLGVQKAIAARQSRDLDAAKREQAALLPLFLASREAQMLGDYGLLLVSEARTKVDLGQPLAVARKEMDARIKPGLDAEWGAIATASVALLRFEADLTVPDLASAQIQLDRTKAAYHSRPQPTEVMLMTARLEAAKGYLETAIKLGEEALVTLQEKNGEKGPISLTWMRFLGDVHAQQKDWRAADARYAQVVALDPDDIMSISRRVHCHIALWQHSQDANVVPEAQILSETLDRVRQRLSPQAIEARSYSAYWQSAMWREVAMRASSPEHERRRLWELARDAATTGLAAVGEVAHMPLGKLRLLERKLDACIRLRDETGASAALMQADQLRNQYRSDCADAILEFGLRKAEYLVNIKKDGSAAITALQEIKADLTKLGRDTEAQTVQGTIAQIKDLLDKK